MSGPANDSVTPRHPQGGDAANEKNPVSSGRPSAFIQNGYLWWTLFLLVMGVHFCWEVLNETPPVWDMAHHQIKGFEHLQAWQGGAILEQFPKLSSYYPPLYYLQEALVLRFFPHTQFLALFSNLLGLFLLAYCSWRIAAFFTDSLSAQVAGVLPLLFPLVAWTSRLSLLDVSLSGWVSAAVYLILKSELLLSRGWTLVLGLTFAAGALTKWTVVIFLFFPLLYALACSSDRKRSAINLMDALIVAIPPIFWWYLPNLKSLLGRFQTTVQAGVWEGDPGLWSLLGWIYYPRCLSGYYLYLPLTVLLVWGAILSSGKGCSRGGRPVQFLWWWLLGSLFLLTLIQAKDPRYVMPAVGPLSILLLVPWKRRRRLVLGIFVLAFVQFLSVSFQMPFSPLKIALFELEQDPDYRSMRQEWVLYQSHYFDVAGPPRRENWEYEAILDTIESPARIGFVPDAPRFNPVTFKLWALRGSSGLEVVRLGLTEDSVDQFSGLGFVVGKTGSQGISYITLYNQAVYGRLEELNWPLVQTWELPDRSQALLWRNPTLSP